MILLALIKEHVIEPDAVAVEVNREVFEMLDVALVAVEAAVTDLAVACVLFCL